LGGRRQRIKSSYGIQIRKWDRGRERSTKIKTSSEAAPELKQQRRLSTQIFGILPR
jgi:hypothetical protein